MKITTEELNELLQKEFERGRQSAINALKQGEPKQPIESSPISIQAYILGDRIQYNADNTESSGYVVTYKQIMI